MFKIRTIILAIFISLIVIPVYGYNYVGNVVNWESTENEINFTCENEIIIKMNMLTKDIFRLRLSTDGNFPLSGMEEWGLVEPNNSFSGTEFTTNEVGNVVWIETPDIKIKIDKEPFRLAVYDEEDNLLTKESASPGMGYGEEGVYLQMNLDSEEHLYGMGGRRDTLDQRGKLLTIWTENVSYYIPIPFFMSTRGYGFYLNNTYRSIFDLGQSSSSYWSIETNGGMLDYYFIYGPELKTILDRYTDITGENCMLPKWALGLWYIGRYYETQDGIVTIGEKYRSKDIPCDVLGLEPGWMEIPYNMNFVWSPERFPNPAEMMAQIDALNFKFELWECGGGPPDYTTPAGGQDWFDKHKPFIDLGVDFFKQDACNQFNVPENRIFANGMTGKEVHNPYSALYSQAMYDNFREYTGMRGLSFTPDGYAGSQRYVMTWAGDTGAGAGSVIANLTQGLSAIAYTSCDIDNSYPAGIHFGYFNAWPHINSFAAYREPWLYSLEIEEMNRFYDKLHYKLMPYIYTSVWQAHTAGLPIMRAMVLEYPDDPNSNTLNQEYMWGDWFLIGAYLNNMYLPGGKWIDYWTGAEFESEGEWKTCNWPSYVGGALFVKGGAIIPMGPVIPYVDKEPLEVVTLDIYPYGNSNYTLYEDDGITYEYENGAYATTEFSCQESIDNILINIGERNGNYTNMPENRSYLLSIHYGIEPVEVLKGTETLTKYDTKEELVASGSIRGWSYDEAKKIIWIKPMSGWYYGADERGEGDPEKDTVYWDEPGPHYEGEFSININLPVGAKIICFADPESIPADGITKSLIQAKITDPKTQELIETSTATITFVVEGLGTLPGGTTEYSVAAVNGIAEVEFTAGTEAGIANIKASSLDMVSGETNVILYGAPNKISLSASLNKILADGLSTSTITATVLDNLNHRVDNANIPITFEVIGEGLLSNGTTSYTVNSIEGIAKTVFTSSVSPDTVTIRAISDGLITGETIIKTLSGKLEASAMPPGEIFLPSNNEWIPHTVTVNVTIKGDGETMTYANNLIHLHITGPSDNLPRDREARAVNGVVSFEDFSFDTPGVYTFHLTSEKIESAQINVTVLLSYGDGGIISQNLNFGKVEINFPAATIEKDTIFEMNNFEQISTELKQKIVVANEKAKREIGIVFNQLMIEGSVCEFGFKDSVGNPIAMKIGEPKEILQETMQVFFPDIPTISFYYFDGNQDGFVDGTDIWEVDLRIYRLVNDKWVKERECWVDTTKNTVNLKTDNLSVFCIMAEKAFHPGELSIENVSNYPNPFSDETYFLFKLGCAADVKIKIYTVKGRLVKTINHSGIVGYNEVRWNARDYNHNLLANGMYYYKIEAEANGKKVAHTDKLIIMR